MCDRPCEDRGWVYMWKGKAGHACHECGRDFHAIGYYLLEKAKALVEQSGIEVAQIKEKFGRMVMYTGLKDPKQEWIVESVQHDFESKYPEFTWDFS